MDYKKIYENALNVFVPEDFEIHHIDLNRSNNDILNLVAIPKDLHVEYHKYHKYLSFDKMNPVGSIIDVPRGYNSNLINNLVRLNELIDLMNDYIDYRDFRLNRFPMIYVGKIFY